jgi:hypothetical protein
MVLFPLLYLFICSFLIVFLFYFLFSFCSILSRPPFSRFYLLPVCLSFFHTIFCIFLSLFPSLLLSSILSSDVAYIFMGPQAYHERDLGTRKKAAIFSNGSHISVWTRTGSDWPSWKPKSSKSSDILKYLIACCILVASYCCLSLFYSGFCLRACVCRSYTQFV